MSRLIVEVHQSWTWLETNWHIHLSDPPIGAEGNEKLRVTRKLRPFDDETQSLSPRVRPVEVCEMGREECAVLSSGGTAKDVATVATSEKMRVGLEHAKTCPIAKKFP